MIITKYRNRYIVSRKKTDNRINYLLGADELYKPLRVTHECRQKTSKASDREKKVTEQGSARNKTPRRVHTHKFRHHLHRRLQFTLL